MNRIIKFNAWDKVNGNMLIDVSIGTINIWCSLDHRIAKSKDCIFLQFTGLKDKNGKEIYESDVVTDEREGFRFVVEHYTGGVATENGGAYNCGFIMRKIKGEWNSKDNNTWLNENLEVIGNIYENPSLLKK